MTTAPQYHRSPLGRWLLAWLSLGLAAPWCISQLGRDLNATIGRQVVNVGFHMTLILLLLTAYTAISTTISLSLMTGFDLDGHGVSFNGLIVAAAVVFLGATVAVIGAFSAMHLRLNEALGEEANGQSVAFIAAMSLALLASLPYLQQRLNRLAGAAQRKAGAAPQSVPT
jgi:hypothetical protein